MKKIYFLRQILSILFILSFVFQSFARPTGPKNEYQMVYDFKNDWELYNSKLELYVPYIKSTSTKEQAYALRINLADYPNTFLIIKNSGPNCNLFFDKTLKSIVKKGQWYIFSINKLKSEIKKDDLSLFFYGETKPEELEISISYKNEAQITSTEKIKKSIINFLPRYNNPFRSILAFGFLIFISLTSFLGSSFSKAFIRYFGIGGLFSKIGKDGAFLINKPLDRPNVLFVILTSTIIAFVILIYSPSQNLRIYTTFGTFEKWGTFADYFIGYLLVLFICLTALIVKYFLLKVVGNLFTMNRLIDIHYFRMIQATLIFGSICTIFFLINHSMNYFGLQNINPLIVQYIIAGFYFFRFIIIFTSLNRIENTNTLYIFCYLCIVEFLPIILGFKLFI